MKVTIDEHLRVSIEDMDSKETMALIEMIKGAGLEERRIFNGVLTELTKTPWDKVGKKKNRGVRKARGPEKPGGVGSWKW